MAGQRRRTPTKSILLPDDDSSRLLLQARLASARSSIGASSAPSATGTEEDVGRSTTTTTMAPSRKKKAPLETAFRCPLCGRGGGVECRVDVKGKAADASCWDCEASYSTGANALTEPVDVYYEWVDQCERARADGGIRRDRDDDVVMVDA